MTSRKEKGGGLSRPLVSPYDYSYIGGQLWYCKVGSQELFITWDETGHPWTLQTGGQTYYYVTNLQGDVVAILNASGDPMVTYTYDAWGNILSIGGEDAATLGQLNPLRYRGYVYDRETGLYYLQSRYYDPKVGRFISADVYYSTGQNFIGNNMFAYCLNNPVCMADYDGKDAIYVVDYGPDGLLLVGHAYVYIQDDDGVWYKTQYMGQFPYKHTATIGFHKVEEMDEVEKILNGENLILKDYVYISGDFSDSVEYAEKQKNTNYGGYWFLWNNCADYVSDVLLKGSIDNSLMRKKLENTRLAIPSEMYSVLKKAELLYSVRNEISSKFKRLSGVFGR